MDILYEKDLNEIRSFVQSKAKYQKVMLLFDETVSNVEISEIYNQIKDLCVFNQSNINKYDDIEINNGYRLIIYYCSAESYLKCGLNREEFENLIIPTDFSVLPFFLADNFKTLTNGCCLINKSGVDVVALISVCFNKFFKFLNNLISGEISIYAFDLVKCVTQQSIVEIINEEETCYIDFELLKKCDLSYKELPIVDLILIDAFLVLINSIKNSECMLVDVYKASEGNHLIIDKLYRLYNNDHIRKLIILNHNSILNYCMLTRNKILELIKFVNMETSNLKEIVNKIKNFSKQNEGLIGCLYLYDIFGV